MSHGNPQTALLKSDNYGEHLNLRLPVANNTLLNVSGLSHGHSDNQEKSHKCLNPSPKWRLSHATSHKFVFCGYNTLPLLKTTPPFTIR